MKTLLFLLLPFMLLGQTYKETVSDVGKEASKAGKESLTSASKFLKETKDYTLATLKSADTSSVSNQIYKDVKSVLKSVAKGLGIASEKVYVVLTKKFFLEGVVGLIVNIVFLISYLWALRFIYKKIFTNFEELKESIPVIALVTTAIMLFLGNVLFNNLQSFPENVGKTFNPEYYTINYIFELLKTVR